VTAAAEPVRLRAADGFELGADLFHPPGEAGPPRAVAVVASAMGVRRRFYGAFASWLAEGGIAALTFDYRGIGDSRPLAGSLRGFDATLHDWGAQDGAAAVAAARARFEGRPLLWIGHSVGGQLLGFVRGAAPDAALFVASQSGWHGNWDGLGRLAMIGVWYGLIPAFTAAVGYLPMRWVGQGEDVPKGVAREWASWGRDPEYLWVRARTLGGADFVTYPGPILSYAFADDGYAPRRSVEALLRLYRAARAVELRHVRPGDVGAEAIGHFGFFAPRFRDTLWKEARDWLLARI